MPAVSTLAGAHHHPRYAMNVNPILSRAFADLAKPVDLWAITSPPSNVDLSLLKHFADLKDPRVMRTRRHELPDILVIAFCAVLGGADSWCAVENFGKAKLDWLRRFLELPNGIPSHDTFSRVFAALDPRAFQNCFTAWINAITIPLGLKRYQIDGKSLRGTNEGLGCLHTVSVWADDG